VKDFCKTYPQIQLNNRFFEDIPSHLVFLSAQTIFSTLQEVRDQYISDHQLIQQSISNPSGDSKILKMIEKTQKLKEEHLKQLEKIERELEELNLSFEKSKQLIEFNKQNQKYLKGICDKLAKIQASNDKIIHEMNQKMEQWLQGYQSKSISSLSSNDVTYLFGVMNIQPSTPLKTSGQDLMSQVQLNDENVLEKELQIKALGDRKRVLEVISKDKVSVIQPSLIVASKSKESGNDNSISNSQEFPIQKASNWSYHEVALWVNNQYSVHEKDRSIYQVLLKEKIDGQQLLNLSRKEMKTVGLKESQRKKLAKMIKKLEKKL
jgi:hypothetical protein